MSKGTKVEAIRFHSFAGKEYNPGDTYVVHGDAHQTEDQYLDSLKGAGLAKVHGDESGPNIVNEIGSPEQAASSTEVKPLTTEDLAPAPKAEAEPAKPAKAKKSAASKVSKSKKK